METPPTIQYAPCPDCGALVEVRTVETPDDVAICDTCGGAVPDATVVAQPVTRLTRRGVFASLLGRAADRLPDV